MDFIVSTKCRGKNMDVYLNTDRVKEKIILFDAGVKMAKIHLIVIKKFGSFSNEIAKNERELIGLHDNYHNFIHCGLGENLERLKFFNILNEREAKQLATLFNDRNYEPMNEPRLIHNDYADWNLLTDGKEITGILDWDECHAGDPIADLACWSTFFDIERMKPFLEGYVTQTNLPDDYEERFHFYRLRYTISKMALRIKRFQVDKSDFIKEKLVVGKNALIDEYRWFKIY